MRWGPHLLQTLQSVHQLGIRHGGVHARNIIVTPDNAVFLLDFDKSELDAPAWTLAAEERDMQWLLSCKPRVRRPTLVLPRAANIPGSLISTAVWLSAALSRALASLQERFLPQPPAECDERRGNSWFAAQAFAAQGEAEEAALARSLAGQHLAVALSRD